jgi:hypothetical protein
MTMKDCWIILGRADQKMVYDVSEYLADHPGGPEVILEQAGAMYSFTLPPHPSKGKMLRRCFKTLATPTLPCLCSRNMSSGGSRPARAPLIQRLMGVVRIAA